MVRWVYHHNEKLAQVEEGFILKQVRQNAADSGLSKEEIQVLGRWTSDAVYRYFRGDISIDVN